MTGVSLRFEEQMLQLSKCSTPNGIHVLVWLFIVCIITLACKLKRSGATRRGFSGITPVTRNELQEELERFAEHFLNSALEGLRVSLRKDRQDEFRTAPFQVDGYKWCSHNKGTPPCNNTLSLEMCVWALDTTHLVFGEFAPKWVRQLAQFAVSFHNLLYRLT